MGTGTFGGAISGGEVLRGHMVALESSLWGACKTQLHLQGCLVLRDQLLSPVTGDDDNRMSPILHPNAAICSLHPGGEMLFHLTSPFPLGSHPGSPPCGPPLPARRALTSLWWDQSQRTASSRPATWSMDSAAMASKCWAHSWQPKKCRT